jgi:hypothetical protein
MSLRKNYFCNVTSYQCNFAQSDKDLKDIKYRRSSIDNIFLVESDAFPKKDKVTML